MASNPKVTESGFATIFRLTNRDDRKGPGLARYLMQKMGKKRALVIDDGTPYGVGLADQFVAGFGAGGTVVDRKSVKVGDQDFADFVKAWPKEFDVVFFGGIREGALILKEMRRQGLTQLFSCGDGCWDVKAFIVAAEGAATKGEGVRILSAAPAVGDVPGSAEFAAKYTAKYGPINNYAASSYDAARVLMAAIAQAAKLTKGAPTRAAVVASARLDVPGHRLCEARRLDRKGRQHIGRHLRERRRRRPLPADRPDRRVSTRARWQVPFRAQERTCAPDFVSAQGPGPW